MKPVKLGVLGVSSHYGLRVHRPAAASPRISLRSIGSRDAEWADAAAARFGFENAYGSYQGVLDDPEVEAVYIPLSNDLHAVWIKKCADAGKAVLCEKPCALDAAEAVDAFDYAASKGVPAMEAFMYRFHPQWVTARELVACGEIGAIRSIHTVFSYFNDDPRNTRNRKETGGGALYDIGCYAVSSARLLMGREPERVVAEIEYDPAAGVDTLTSGILDFGGPRSVFTVSMRMAGRQRVTAYGSRGSLTVHRPFNAYPDVPLKLEVDDGDGPRIIDCGPADQYGLMLDAFALSVREGRPVPIPASDAINNMKVIDALYRSGNSGNWEAV